MSASLKNILHFCSVKIPFGTVFAERERERERETYVRYIIVKSACIALFRAHISNIFREFHYGRSNVFVMVSVEV